MALDVSSHAARWTGRQVTGQTDWVHEFSSVEITELRRFAATFAARGVSPLSLIGHPPQLPTLEPMLAKWAQTLRFGRGFLLARGLPVSEMSLEEVSAVYLGLGAHLGTPVAQNSAGELLGHVRDDGSDPDDPTVRRYRTKLPQPFHVDGADLVGLLCLRQARSGGLSQIVSSVTVYDEISRRRPDLEPLLWLPWCFDTYGQSVPGANRPWFEQPLLRGTAETFSFFFIRWYIDRAQHHEGVTPLTSPQVELLDLIDALADDKDLHLDMDFAPGDIQLLSNHTVLHSRTGYDDFDEPERKRHLLRLWLNHTQP